MTEAAVAEVSLIIVSKGAGRQIERAIDQDDPGTKAGHTVGDKMLGGMAASLKVGALGLGATAAAGIGTALVKGFQRLDGLDQARAKLTGLGHDASTVDTVMTNALSSVKGTAFGMAEAGSTAANVVASGVKPGKELERTLKLIADASTIAGTGMGDMGAIFNKAAASNKVQMDVINQLHDAGVPALALLADQMGVTAAEASKMASRGQIDFATFQAAIEQGMGGAAQASGETFTGALDNVQAALGRIGASLLGGVFESAKGVFGEFTTIVDGMGPVADSAGRALGSFAQDVIPLVVSGVTAIGTAISAVIGWIQDNVTWLGPLAVGLASAAAAYLAVSTAMAAYKNVVAVAKAVQLAFNVALAANPLGIVLLAVTALVAGLVWFFTQTKLGQEVWANICSFMQTAWQSVVDFLVGAWDAIVGFITSYITTVQMIIMTVVTAIVVSWQTFWTGISDFFRGIWEAIAGFVVTVMLNIQNTIATAIALVKLGWETVWNGISTFFMGLWAGIVAKIGEVKSTFEHVFGAISGFISGAFNNAGAIVRSAINTIIGLVNGAIGGINDVIGAVGGVFGFEVAIPTIPKLARGGIVSKRPGGVLANIGEGRSDEAVVPLNSKFYNALGGAGTAAGNTYNITVTAPEGTSAAALAAAIRREVEWTERVT